jgi:hypothetical protein
VARRWWTNTQKKSVVWKGQDGRKQTAKINTKDAKKKDVANCSMERVSAVTAFFKMSLIDVKNNSYVESGTKHIHRPSTIILQSLPLFFRLNSCRLLVQVILDIEPIFGNKT